MLRPLSRHQLHVSVPKRRALAMVTALASAGKDFRFSRSFPGVWAVPSKTGGGYTRPPRLRGQHSSCTELAFRAATPVRKLPRVRLGLWRAP